jgi:hypothetical protein
MPWPLNPRGKSPRYHWIGGWIGSRSDLDDVETRKILPLTGFELRTLVPPYCSSSLYRLCCAGSDLGTIAIKILVLLPYCRSQWPRGKARTVFIRSNTGVVVSNLTQGIDVCLRLFCVCVGSGLVTGCSPSKGFYRLS